ncbi:hypothetical protein F4777DRAFT_536471 [Nemania sp. FL0916]|nr:hypothetical protein F4777DRAFT_536471 [Nemania sp. FL0916]
MYSVIHVAVAFLLAGPAPFRVLPVQGLDAGPHELRDDWKFELGTPYTAYPACSKYRPDSSFHCRYCLAPTSINVVLLNSKILWNNVSIIIGIVLPLLVYVSCMVHLVYI